MIAGPVHGPTTEKGRAAETAGEHYLLEQGYRIVGRNVRTRGGELDRIAWDGDTLCFVEIRSRSNLAHGSPEETVNYRKQVRLIRAARAYLQRFRGEPPACRFDVLAMNPDEQGVWEYRLYRDAFRS